MLTGQESPRCSDRETAGPSEAEILSDRSSRIALRDNEGRISDLRVQGADENNSNTGKVGLFEMKILVFALSLKNGTFF